jgi:oxygen-independent coproporphyrinogen III oxidase
MTRPGGQSDEHIFRGLSADFLARYNKSGPRYTSYPTAPEWSAAITHSDLREWIAKDAQDKSATPVSIYIHIPFCRQRCRYCGCNVITTNKSDVIESYLHLLDKEMEIMQKAAGRSAQQWRPVSQLHIGGGTPTTLSPEQLEWLLQRVRTHCHFTDNPELSLEADPCVTTDEHINTLAHLGFNRISFGVQDFNKKTQEAIGRKQTVEETRHLTQLARQCGMESVNYDLIYGLPYQSVESFGGTIDSVVELKPDRIALYNFAYLPGRLAHQRSLDPESLPSGTEKFEIFTSAYERFVGAGYEYIGMDHYALPGDALARAWRERTIQRNFMGYTTQAGTDLYAFGTSAISTTDRIYTQNTKKLSEYERSLAAGELPVVRGMLLSDDDRLRGAVIYSLMCHGRLVKSDIEKRFAIDFENYFALELEQLPAFEKDGMLEIKDGRIEVTLLGLIFVRNIAMIFDKYLRTPKDKKTTYSRTL